MDIQQKKTIRFKFLDKLYQDGGGSLNAVYDMHEVGEELGLDYSATSDSVDYLSGEGLIKPYGLGGTICLTHSGVKEVEQAHAHPEQSTTHFSPVNYIHINSSGDGNVINTGDHNVFTVSNHTSTSKVVEKANEIISALNADPLVEQTARREAIDLLEQLIAESKKGKTSKSTMDQILTIGSNISSIGSLVISLFQLVSTS